MGVNSRHGLGSKRQFISRLILFTSAAVILTLKDIQRQKTRKARNRVDVEILRDPASLLVFQDVSDDQDDQQHIQVKSSKELDSLSVVSYTSSLI